MAINISKIKNISAETKTATARKSAQTLPNNPSEQGYSAEAIKRRFYQPILDASNSAYAEIDRVANEANSALGEISEELSNFMETSQINDAYRMVLNSDSWVSNDEKGCFEVLISKATHGISDYTKIGVDMFLLDGDGNYISVNQYEVQLDGDVRCYHETPSVGHVVVYEKREGFIIGTSVVDVENVKGLAKVGLTNDYRDLDNAPDGNLALANEANISKILTGEKEVGKSKHAETATTATYAQSSGTAAHAETAISATNATNATNATKATHDSEGYIIKNVYAKQNGNYPHMSVGKATTADNAVKATNAENATNAEKSSCDSEGKNIVDFYAKKDGIYSDMSVGKATIAEYASEDTSKGTIEERLTNLGFKQGSVILKNNFTATHNKLNRIGNIVIGQIEFKIPTTLVEGQTYDFFELPSGFTPVISPNIDNGWFTELCLPEVETNPNNYYICLYTNIADDHKLCKITVEKKGTTDKSRNLRCVFHYEAEPLT